MIESSDPAQRSAAPPAPPIAFRNCRGRAILTTAAAIVLPVATFALGYYLRPSEAASTAERPERCYDRTTPRLVSSASVRGNPGPWGDLEYVPITVAAPEELLPVRALEENATRWFFKGLTRDDVAKFLDTLDMPADQKDALLNRSNLQAQPTGVEVTPPRELHLNLDPKAREGIYKLIAGHDENGGTFHCVLTKGIDERFRTGDVSDDTVKLFKRLSWVRGNYFIFSGMSALLASVPTYEEKVRFMKVLSEQKTLLMRLHVSRKSDVNALTRYWGKMCWNTDVKAFIDSLARLPGGAAFDLVEVLPPFPSSHLFTFPMPQNPMNGPVVRRDCHWTAFNFFRDPPDPRFSDPAYVGQKIKEDYFPVTSDPRYGDVVLLAKPDGSIIHSAVFMADNVVYTKNGDTPIHPWMFMTIPDMLDQYSFHVAPDEKLTVNYIRNKYQ